MSKSLFLATLVALLALTLTVSVSAQVGEGFSEIITMDCNGGFTLFGSHDLMKIKANLPLKGMVDFWLNELFNRGTCYCPSMTFNDFDRTFLLGALLNMIKGPQRNWDVPCADKDWLADNWRYGIFNESKIVVNLPAGCDLATWQSGGACLAKQAMPSLDLTLQVAIKKCPASYYPFLSLTCAGEGCPRVMMPCNNGECGSTLPCTPIGPVCSASNRSECPPDYVYNWTNANFYDSLVNMSLYDEGDTAPGCYNAKTFWEDIVSRVKAHFRQSDAPYVFQSGELNTLRFCMNMTDTFIFRTENSTKPTDTNTSQTMHVLDITCKIGASAVNASFIELSCETIKVWDGQIDAERGSVLSPNRIDGSVFTEVNPTLQPTATESNAILLASHSCSNEIHILPSNPRLHISAKFPSLNDNIYWFFSKVYAMQRCRAQVRYSDLPWENFRIRFFDIIGMLYSFVLPGPANPIPSLLSPEMSDWIPNATGKVVMPDTCTYDSWKNNGLCAIQWTGLQSMLKMGITLRAYAKDCGAFRVPEFKLECVGSGCGVFIHPQLCTASTECPQGTECFDVYDAIYDNLDENSTVRDIFQSFYRLNTTVEPDTCGSESNGRKTLRNFIRYLNGQPSDGLESTKICMANFTKTLEDFNMTTWAEAQATVDADRVTLHTITAWSPVGVAPVTRPTTVSITFTVTGSTTNVESVITDAYPNAQVQVTTNGNSATVTVVLTGSNAEGSAQTLSTELQNPTSTLTTTLVQGGATPQGSSVTVAPSGVVSNPDGSASSLGLFAPLLALAIYLASF